MRLCYDATRFGFGLKEAVGLAVMKSLTAVEFTFQPFPVATKAETGLSSGELTHLKELAELLEQHGVDLVCVNLDYCIDAEERSSVTEFKRLIAKLSRLAEAVGCRRLSFWLESGNKDDKWLEDVERALAPAVDQSGKHGVKLVLRLSTPSRYRGKSLQTWHPMQPQDWRDLLSLMPELSLSFSPADCLWQGLDYLQLLPSFVSAIEHVEALDVEINHEMLKDSGLFGPLWWRYRLPGKGQMDWRQLVEALKLYDFSGCLSVHLEDEFVPNHLVDLDRSLDTGMSCLSSLVEE